MITNPIVVKALLASAALLTGAIVFIRLGPSLTTAWRNASGLGRCLFIFGSLALALYGGSKAPTNSPPMRMMAGTPRQRVLRDVKAWPEKWFAMPVGASEFEPWNIRGAREDWTPVAVGDETYIALVNGVLRLLPRSLFGELGLTSIGPDGAVPGQSRLWWTTEPGGTHVVTWERFYKAGLDAPYSLQLRIEENQYSIRTNGVFASTYVAYDPCDDTTLTLSLGVPRGVFVNGDRRALSLACSSDRAIEGRLRLEQSAGAGLVSLWTATNGGSYVSLPVEFDAATFEGATYYVQAESASSTIDDVTFTATLVGDGPDPHTVSSEREMTSVEILRIDISSLAQGVSTNPPPFEPGYVPVFDVTKSVTPDKHLVIPFGNVADAALNVSNFTIDAAVVTRPNGYSEGVDWFREDLTPDSGTIDASAPFSPKLVNPSEGGVYTIAANIGGVDCGWTVVLPLAGGEIYPTITNDLRQADAFVAWARDRFPDSTNELGRIVFGIEYFCMPDNGYYLGRPDTDDPRSKTCRHYNQVDANGMGAVASLAQYPTRIEKMSNLLCAYTCEKLGVTASEQEIAQGFGTENDATATMSWNAGVELAHTFLPELALTAVASNMWQQSGTKERTLWPNGNLPDNHTAAPIMTNFDWLFFSPGFLLYGL